jgi:hypothetical protein
MSRDRKDAGTPQEGPAERRGGISRRAVLTGAAGAALGTLASAIGARAQVTGLTPGGGTVPFRLPMGALPFLDSKQYVHNMQIHAHLPGVRFTSGEPLVVMWARGKQRLLPAGPGWLDVSEGAKPTLIETGQIRTGGAVAYNRTLRKWIMMVSAGRPLSGANPKFPYGQYHEELKAKVNSFSGLRGIRTYDVTDPTRPVLLQEFSTGKTGGGTHHNFYDGGKYAYLDAGWDDDLRMENAQRPSSNGIMIVDMSDPANIQEVSRWWVPGQRIGEEEEYKKYWFAGDQSSWTGNHGALTVPRRVEDGGRYGFGGFGHFGMFVFDLSDIRKPKPVGRLQWDFETLGGIPYHTVYTLAGTTTDPKFVNLAIGVPETVQPDCREPFKPVQVIDLKDPANPRIIGLFGRPKAPQGAPYADFCQARGRFGWHNTQAWVAPGSTRPHLMAVTAFGAGVRLFDISDPREPKEVAWFVPARDGNIEDYETWFRGTAETVFVEWDRNLIWLGTHEGTYCLSTPALGAPVLEARPVERWNVPHVNAGFDERTPTSVYFGRSSSEIG